MRVQILLSTYHGEAYLKPLMDSLLAQNYPQAEILARDDGSSDRTPAVLQEYAAACPKVRVVFGENLGVTRSIFISLSLPRLPLTSLRCAIRMMSGVRTRSPEQSNG